MVIKGYNRQKHTPEGIDPDILETMLGSSIEAEAQCAFKKLLSQPAELTPDDSARLLTYLEVQRIRYERTWDDAQVNRHNWCMLYLSKRFIVGRSKDILEKAIDPEPRDYSYIHRGF